MNTPSKDTIIELLYAWINQKPGLDPQDYGYGREGWNNYRSEAKRITGQKHDALILLNSVENSGITAEELVKAFQAYSGRLEITQEGSEYRLSYCTGQYWPTEYRAAACAVLASALWAYHRDANDTGDDLRKKFVRMFGRPLASRWLD